MDGEISTRELLQAINCIKDSVEKKLNDVEKKLNDKMDEKFEKMDEKFEIINAKVDQLQGDMSIIKREVLVLASPYQLLEPKRRAEKHRQLMKTQHFPRSVIICSLTGTAGSASGGKFLENGSFEPDVCCAHIIPVSAKSNILSQLGKAPSWLNDPSNCIWLAKGLEMAFDFLQISFKRYKNKGGSAGDIDSYCLHIWDNEVRAMPIFEGSAKKIGEFEGKKLVLPKNQTLSKRALSIQSIYAHERWRPKERAPAHFNDLSPGDYPLFENSRHYFFGDDEEINIFHGTPSSSIISSTAASAPPSVDGSSRRSEDFPSLATAAGPSSPVKTSVTAKSPDAVLSPLSDDGSWAKVGARKTRKGGKHLGKR
jgi:hypothetical protein